MKILVIEDEPKTAAYLAKGLRENGYVVDHAGDGGMGAHMAVITRYDLIILDVMLPVARQPVCPGATTTLAGLRPMGLA